METESLCLRLEYSVLSARFEQGGSGGIGQAQTYSRTWIDRYTNTLECSEGVAILESLEVTSIGDSVRIDRLQKTAQHKSKYYLFLSSMCSSKANLIEQQAHAILKITFTD